MLIWAGFLLSLGLLLIIARKNLWLGLMTGAVILGIFNLQPLRLLSVMLNTITDLDILLLAFAVSLIPIIGGALQTTGLLNDLVNNLQVKRQFFLALSPAFMGLLPLPGGALLSAPMLIKAGDDIKPQDYAAINVWFRHILIMIYPLGALLTCSKMAEIDLYLALRYILPVFVLFSIIGYLFLLRRIKGNMPSAHKINYRRLSIPVLIIISAPVIHIVLTQFSVKDEIALISGIFCSLIFVTISGKMKLNDFGWIIKKMKPWKFFLIIIGIFLFLNMFIASEISDNIAAAVFSRDFLIVLVAAFLGFVTGRIQLPISILLPIYFAKYTAASLTPQIFAVMYSSAFVGYMLSPVHPCVSISLEYFKSTFKDFTARLIVPGSICLILLYLTAWIFL